MDDNIRNWIEKVTERANIIHQEDTCSPNVLRGAFYCSEVGWKVEKITKLVDYLRAFGEPEETIDDIRAAYSAFVLKK